MKQYPKFKKGEHILYFKDKYFEEAVVDDVHTDDIQRGIYYTIKVGETRWLEDDDDPKFYTHKEVQTTEIKLVSREQWFDYNKRNIIPRDLFNKHHFHLLWNIIY